MSFLSRDVLLGVVVAIFTCACFFALSSYTAAIAMPSFVSELKNIFGTSVVMYSWYASVVYFLAYGWFTFIASIFVSRLINRRISYLVALCVVLVVYNLLGSFAYGTSVNIVITFLLVAILPAYLGLLAAKSLTKLSS